MAKCNWSALLSCLTGARQRNHHIHARKRRSRPAVERLEDRTVPSLSGIAFGGLNYDPSQGLTPPDTIMSAGPNHVVEAVNTNLLFINKATIPNNITGTV